MLLPSLKLLSKLLLNLITNSVFLPVKLTSFEFRNVLDFCATVVLSNTIFQLSSQYFMQYHCPIICNCHIIIEENFSQTILLTNLLKFIFYSNQLLSLIPIRRKNIIFQFKLNPMKNACSKFDTVPKPCYLLFNIIMIIMEMMS